MTNYNKLIFGLFCSICMSMTVACSSQDDVIDDIQNEQDSNQPHTCELVLNITKSGFDDEPQSRGASGWTNGDKIYLTFTVGSGTSYGDAVYNNGSWTVNYYGSLTEGATTNCTAVYFDNPEFESSSVVKITEGTGIYEDTTGSYIFNDGTLSVTANLKPKTGRIRFAGTDNDEITLYGVSHYTSYDCSNGKFTTSIGALKTKVASGYTPYVYGYFSDSEQPRLNIITATSGYTRLLPTSIYQPGESGYMNIPSESSHNGWQNSVILKVNGVEFTMIPVVYSYGNFLLAETETTQQLYGAITGASTSTSQIPKYGLSYDEWSDFISKLSAITELNFRKPTREEWQYAFKGCNKTQGYTYSGSNIISNVAWYSGNSNSSIHKVKQLQPNELGFYDMSGNVWEVTSTSNGSYYYWFGGCCSSSESNCKISSYQSVYFSNSFSSGGLRLALSNN